MKTFGGYGRYDDDIDYIGCPRAKSDMTPCVARDGENALEDDTDICVGCAHSTANLLMLLVKEVTQPRPQVFSSDIMINMEMNRKEPYIIVVNPPKS